MNLNCLLQVGTAGEGAAKHVDVGIPTDTAMYLAPRAVVVEAARQPGNGAIATLTTEDVSSTVLIEVATRTVTVAVATISPAHGATM